MTYTKLENAKEVTGIFLHQGIYRYFLKTKGQTVKLNDKKYHTYNTICKQITAVYFQKAFHFNIICVF